MPRAGGIGKGADQPVEGLRRAPVLLLLVGWQFQRDHRHRQVERLRQPAGIVLDQFGGAGSSYQDRLRLEAFIGFRHGRLEQFGGVAAEVAGLEGGVGHRRALGPPLDHGEQQIGVGVALRSVQHVMHAFHRGGDPHGSHMGRGFVCPERQLHGVRPPVKGCGGAGGRTGRQIGRLLVAMDGGEQQLDRPLRRQAFRLQRVGEAEAADRDIGLGGAAAVELAFHVLAFAQQRAGGQQRQFVRQMRRGGDRACRLRSAASKARSPGNGRSVFQAGCRGRRKRACPQGRNGIGQARPAIFRGRGR